MNKCFQTEDSAMLIVFSTSLLYTFVVLTGSVKICCILRVSGTVSDVCSCLALCGVV